MSRTKTSWVVATITALVSPLLVLGGASPASADASSWNPPAPVVSDPCGTSQNAFKTLYTDDTLYSWNGTYLGSETWYPTGTAPTVTVVAKYIYAANPQPPDVTFTLTFGVEPDSACVEAADTVSTRIVSCNQNTNGTRVEFVYTNVDDATDRTHNYPILLADRWDGGQSASFAFTQGAVPDGQTATIEGGDAGENAAYTEFFLAPGTYYMWLSTKEYGRRKLPNTFFVPACGDYKPPKGDPQGGTVPTTPTTDSALPKGKLVQVSATKMKVKAINRGVPRATTFKVIIDPRKGKTVTKTFKVGKNKVVTRAYKAPARTRFVLKARVAILDANGRLVNKWKVLKRSTLKAR